MGHDLSEGKITAPHLKEVMSTEFEISVVSIFLVRRSGPVRYQKAVKHFSGLRFEPLHPSSCSSNSPRTLSSHRKKKLTSKTQENFSYFHSKFEIDANEIETPSELGSFLYKKHTLPVGFFSVRCI